jgi:hypothetical protein
MPKGFSGWIFLAVFLVAVWYAWSRFFRNKVV